MKGQLTPEVFRARLRRERGGCLVYMRPRRPHRGPGANRRGNDDQVRLDGRRVSPAMFAWTIAHGPPPPGQFPVRTCRNLRCCRLEHLKLATSGSAAPNRRERAKLTLLQVAIVRALPAGMPYGFWQHLGARLGVSAHTLASLRTRASRATVWREVG